MTHQPTPSSPRMGLPRHDDQRLDDSDRMDRRRRERIEAAHRVGRSVTTQHPDHVAFVVADGDDQGHLARHRMRRAAEAGVVGPEGHLDPVEEALADLGARGMRLRAALSIDMAMAPWLLVVPTMRLTL